LVVEQKESSKFRSWLYRCDLFVVDDNFLKEQARQSIALLWQGGSPCRTDVRQQFG
jgi:hypothetical protein